MTFSNVYHLLGWFFRKKWLRPPKMPGNHSMVYVQHSRMPSDPKDDYDTIKKIDEALSNISLKDFLFLEKLFTNPLDEVASDYGVTERRIRQRRFQIVKKLTGICGEVGLFGEPIYQEPVFRRDANEAEF